MLAVRLRLSAATLLYLRACSSAMGNTANKDIPSYTSAPPPKVSFPEEELRDRLSAEEYRVTRLRGTERAWSGQLI